MKNREYRGDFKKWTEDPGTWGNNEWHPDSQWLLEALDVDKRELRTFALANIHSWNPAPL